MAELTLDAVEKRLDFCRRLEERVERNLPFSGYEVLVEVVECAHRGEFCIEESAGSYRTLAKLGIDHRRRKGAASATSTN